MPYKLHAPGKRGKFWYLRGTIAGQRVEVSTRKTDRASAEQWAAQYVVDFHSDAVPNPGEPVTFTEAARAFIAFKRPKLDDERLILAIAAWFDGEPTTLPQIRHAHLVKASQALRPRGSNATRNRKVIGPAAAVLHYAAEQGWCEYRRYARFKVSRRSPREPVSDADMARLVNATEGHQRLILAMLYETGLRISDTLAIRWDDVDLQAGRVVVHVGKNDERASLPLSSSLVVMLANMAEKSGAVFPWTSRMSVYKWLRPMCRRMKIKYTPHLSRHALATDLQAAGVPDKAAAEYGVWRDVRSLHRYQKVRPELRPDRNVGRLELGDGLGDAGKRRVK